MNAQIIALAAAALSVFALLWFAKRGKPRRYPYQRQPGPFSSEGQAFFRVLQDALAGEYALFGKLRVDAVIAAKANAPDAFDGRDFDFVLCDKATLAVACVILLDTQESPRPDPLPLVCENLGLPCVRFRAGVDFSAEAVRATLRSAMAKEPLDLAQTHGRKEPRISNIDDLTF